MKALVTTALLLSAQSALAHDLPVPPVPPTDWQVSENAPVPDVDARAPVGPASEETTVALRLYRAPSYSPGMAFAPGSRYRSAEDRKPIQTPGLSINVPLR